MSPKDVKQKIDELVRRTEVVDRKKSNLAGQLQSKKEELAALIQEIRAAGFEPKTLKAELDKAQAELEGMMATYEKNLTEVESALSAYDKK